MGRYPLANADAEADESCDSCRFWIEVGSSDAPGDSVDGVCRRYPPQQLSLHALEMVQQGRANGVRSGRAHTQPETLGDDWCGEFRPRSAVAELPPLPEVAPPEGRWGEFQRRISGRAAAALHRLGIETFAALYALPRDELFLARNVGPATVSSIREGLELIGATVLPACTDPN